jgi:hypothetical protein
MVPYSPAQLHRKNGPFTDGDKAMPSTVHATEGPGSPFPDFTLPLISISVPERSLRQKPSGPSKEVHDIDIPLNSKVIPLPSSAVVPHKLPKCAEESDSAFHGPLYSRTGESLSRRTRRVGTDMGEKAEFNEVREEEEIPR